MKLAARTLEPESQVCGWFLVSEIKHVISFDPVLKSLCGPILAQIVGPLLGPHLELFWVHTKGTTQPHLTTPILQKHGTQARTQKLVQKWTQKLVQKWIQKWVRKRRNIAPTLDEKTKKDQSHGHCKHKSYSHVSSQLFAEI